MITIINETSFEKVPLDIKEIIPDVIDIFKSQFGKNILEIRLLGSVPRGEFIENVSDVDFLCILKSDCNVKESNIIKEGEKRLSNTLKRYSKIDLDFVSERYLEKDFGYKLLIETDSICIYGENKYCVNEFKIAGTDLAKLWNPNSINLLSEYRKRLSETNHIDEIKELSKLIGKDFIKSFRPILMKQNEVFSRSIMKSKINLCNLDIANTSLYEKLFELYEHQTSSKSELFFVLEAVERYIDENKRKIME